MTTHHIEKKIKRWFSCRDVGEGTESQLSAEEALSGGYKAVSLILVEKATIVYTLFTTLLVLVLSREMDNVRQLLEGRAFVLGGMALLYAFYRLRPNRTLLLLRYIFPLTLLGYWYPDTYEFCRLFPNLDYIFAEADGALFGCQPSLEFSRVVTNKVLSELFHMGYFAYYPLILLTVLAPLVTDKRLFSRTAFVVLTAFFLYYIIYIFVPVAGPQYYFHAVGENVILSGHFPRLGDYFRYHIELAPGPGPDGFFRSLVETTQQSGERPTAAFPSSHVGMSTVLLILLWQNRKYLLFAALPFYVFLCCATVYIQAHYLIDVIGGWVTAPLFYMLADKYYSRHLRKKNIPQQS